MKHDKAVVAVVENDAGLLKALGRLLFAFDYAPIEFESAEQFLAYQYIDDVECLVLDINLDGMSGIQLQRVLRAQGSQVPVIFITGRGDAATEASAHEFGCSGFLHKPFESTVLRSTLAAAIAPQAQADRIA